MKKFTYKFCLYGTKDQLHALLPVLSNLGYHTLSVDREYNPNKQLAITNVYEDDRTSLAYVESLLPSLAQCDIIIQCFNPTLLQLVAAARNDKNYYQGELVIALVSNDYFTKGNAYLCRSTTTEQDDNLQYVRVLIVSDDKGWANGMYEPFFRKATLEEIVKYCEDNIPVDGDLISELDDIKYFTNTTIATRRQPKIIGYRQIKDSINSKADDIWKVMGPSFDRRACNFSRKLYTTEADMQQTDWFEPIYDMIVIEVRAARKVESGIAGPLFQTNFNVEITKEKITAVGLGDDNQDIELSIDFLENLEELMGEGEIIIADGQELRMSIDTINIGNRYGIEYQQVVDILDAYESL